MRDGAPPSARDRSENFGPDVRMGTKDGEGDFAVGERVQLTGRIGPISLDVKRMGERNAGNPHVAFDVEGAGTPTRWPAPTTAMSAPSLMQVSKEYRLCHFSHLGEK
jgi:hypothetical protein